MYRFQRVLPRPLSLACLRDEFESCATRYGSSVRGVSGIRQGTPDAVEKLRGTDLYRGWIGATARPETPFWHSMTWHEVDPGPWCGRHVGGPGTVLGLRNGQ